MLEIAAIGSAVGLLKNLSDLATKYGEDIPQEVRQLVLELSKTVLDVQTELLAAQQREFKLAERSRELENELSRVGDWESERGRYVLRSIGGASVYAQREATTDEDPHWLCANCFVIRKKSYVQAQGQVPPGRNQKWQCSRCDATFVIHRSYGPSGG